MIKSLSFRSFVLCAVALIGAGAVSARSGGITASVHAVRPAVFKGINPLADSGLIVSASLLPTVLDGQNNWFWKFWKNDKSDDRFDRDDHHDRYKDNDDKKGEKNDRAPAPSPEPSTLLSFGAALVIGAGVLFLRRLHGVRK